MAHKSLQLDRISSEYTVKPTSSPLSYTAHKSPADPAHDFAGPVTYEDGALRPANGPISIYHWKNLGMAAHLAGVGVVYHTITSVIYSVLNNYLHMSATLVATATALVTFPRALRLFTGMLTDRVPIFGYRRRPYMLIGWSLSFVSCLLMAALPLGEPYYTDSSLQDIDVADMTPEQLETINEDAPDSGIKLIILMMIANFGVVMGYSGFNGVLVDVSQREPEHLRGTAMGDCTVVHYIFAVISTFMTGIGLNNADYGGSFSWTVGFNNIMWVCAAASLLTMPFSIWCIQEEKVESIPRKSVWTFLYELLQKRHIYRFVAFNFFYNVFAAVTVTSSSAIQSTWAGVTPLNSGIANMLTAALTIAGAFTAKKYGLGWDWRLCVVFCQVLVVVIDVAPTFLTIWDVVRNQWLWLGVPLLEKAPTAAIGFITGLFTFELLDITGYEATMIGLSVTTQEVGSPFATVLTKTMNGYFDVERTFIEEDTHHVRSQVSIVYIIMYIFNLASLVFIIWLPRQKAELREMERVDRRNKWWGIFTIAYLAFSLLWTLMTNILSLFDSTSCLRIAGGSGC